MLRKVDVLAGLGDPEIEAAVYSLEPKTFRAGEVIYRQDEEGEDCFFVVKGECYATKVLFRLEEGQRVTHAKHGAGVVEMVTAEPHITKVVFDNGESHNYTPPSLHKLKPVDAAPPTVKEVMQYTFDGHPFFGERLLSRSEPRAATITCRTDVTVLRLTAETFLLLKAQQDEKEQLLRDVAFFEAFSDEQITSLASVLVPRDLRDGETVLRQGEQGHHLYIVVSGECVATIRDGACVQEVMRYHRGQLFGEKALLETEPRAATITAVGAHVKVWMLSLDAFEAKLGPINQLRAEQYLADPRHLIAQFYNHGDAKGPAGTLKKVGAGAPPAADAPTPAMSSSSSSWFAVYRPCSRDSIAKMLGRVGVGKGLNIKGKSAKKNRLSGFVPFVQISRNEDKKALEKTPFGARCRVFYRSASARATARASLESTMAELSAEHGAKLNLDDPKLRVCGQEYEDSCGAYGLDVPEEVLMEAYIMRQDVSPLVGWETGRGSEPAFLDMNRHALRDGVAPPVVLYQFDLQDAMNPLGLLMAYAEARVAPVVSDFDTLLVGSRGMRYEPTPADQVAIMHWSLDQTKTLLETPSTTGWMGRWLSVLKESARNGFHPKLPQYGFGDPTSYGLIGDIVSATAECGAVRHGAECFNFYFPQELDENFLVVWDGFTDPPWRSGVTEPELREFLLARAADGFSFPLNPVWPVRDPGWHELLHALLASGEEATANLKAWFPPESGILERIEQLHAEFPTGFAVAQKPSKRISTTPSFYRKITDVDTRDMAAFADLEVRKEIRFRWRRILGALKWKLVLTGVL